MTTTMPTEADTCWKWVVPKLQAAARVVLGEVGLWRQRFGQSR